MGWDGGVLGYFSHSASKSAFAGTSFLGGDHLCGRLDGGCLLRVTVGWACFHFVIVRDGLGGVSWRLGYSVQSIWPQKKYIYIYISGEFPFSSASTAYPAWLPLPACDCHRPNRISFMLGVNFQFLTRDSTHLTEQSPSFGGFGTR